MDIFGLGKLGFKNIKKEELNIVFFCFSKIKVGFYVSFCQCFVLGLPRSNKGDNKVSSRDMIYFCDFCRNTFESTLENNCSSEYNCVTATSAVIQLKLKKHFFSGISAENQTVINFFQWFSQNIDFF